MSIQKTEVLIVGSGAINDNPAAAHILSTTNVITAWSNVISYNVNNVVEFSGNAYRSTQNSNSGNTPSGTSTFWELLYTGVQDGDIALLVAGSNSDVLLRKGGIWLSAANTPLSVTIAPSLTNFVWLSIPLAIVEKAFFDYSVTRGPNLRNGNMNVITDGATAQLVEYAVNAIGADAGITFDAVVSGSNINFLATTDAQVASITMRYVIKAWT